MALVDLDRRVLALAVARMVDAIGNSFLIVVLPAFIASGAVGGSAFGLTQALVTGVVLSAFGFLNSFSQPFTGRLSDRVGKRKVFILFGLAVLVVTNLAYVWATTYTALIGIRVVQGVGVAFTIPCTIALVNELATAETRGGNMGLFNTFRLVGFGAGPLLAGVVIEAGPYVVGGGAGATVDAATTAAGAAAGGTAATAGQAGAVTVPLLGALPFAATTLSGFDAAFLIAAFTALVGFVMVEFIVEDAEETRSAASTDVGISVFADDGDGLLDPVFVMGMISLFLAIGVALFATIQPEINARLNQGSTVFSAQFSAFILAQITLQIPVGQAADAYGRKALLVLGMALFVPFTLAQGFVTTQWGMFLARLFQGIAGALVFAPALALAGDLAREGRSGSTMSVLTMSFGLGTALGPLLSGYTIRFGFAAPFAVGAVLAAVGVVLVVTQVEETHDDPVLWRG